MSPDILKKMRDMGLTLDQAIELLEAMTVAPQPSSGAKRQRAYRERRAATRDITDDVTRDATDDVTDPPSLPLSPQTPQTPTHPPGCSNTRATHEREEAAFGRFWAAYPRKVSKAEARKAFSRAWRKLPPLEEEAVLTGGLERAMASWTDAQFIPHAATWLNQERWTDEPTVIPLNPNRQAHDRPDPKLAAKHANFARAFEGSERAAGRDWKP